MQAARKRVHQHYLRSEPYWFTHQGHCLPLVGRQPITWVVDEGSLLSTSPTVKMSKHEESREAFLRFTGKEEDGPLNDKEWKELWKNNYIPWHNANETV